VPFLTQPGVRASTTNTDVSPPAVSRAAWITSNSVTVSTAAGANGAVG